MSTNRFVILFWSRTSIHNVESMWATHTIDVWLLAQHSLRSTIHWKQWRILLSYVYLLNNQTIHRVSYCSYIRQLHDAISTAKYHSWLLFFWTSHCRAFFQAYHIWLETDEFAQHCQCSPFGSETAAQFFEGQENCSPWCTIRPVDLHWSLLLWENCTDLRSEWDAELFLHGATLFAWRRSPDRCESPSFRETFENMRFFSLSDSAWNGNHFV